MNIVYIHTHDTGRVISPYGYNVPTPNYQKFCEDAVLFQEAYCVAPTCSPSRSGLLTGVYPHQNGMLGLAQRGFEIDQKKHIANILKNNNYHTVLCGVQHEIGYYTDHQMAIGTIGYKQDLSANNDKYCEKDLVIWDKENAQNICDFLNTYNAEQSFFLSYGMHATHREYPSEIDDSIDVDYCKPPGNLPNNKIMREDFAKFKTSLKIADDNIGMILDSLKKNGLYDTSIIFITTDHGLANPFAKCSLNDSGTGVLFAMRVPGMHPQNKTFDGLISHIDVVPTLCDLVGIKKPAYLQGTSFKPVFDGEIYMGDEAIYSEINFHTSYEPTRAVRTKRYKYIRYFDEEYLKINLSNVDDSIVKDFYDKNDLEKVKKDAECLYDLYYDTFEKNNLIHKEEYSEVIYTMRTKLKEFMKNTKDPLLQGKIEVKNSWKVNKRESYSAGSKNIIDYESLGDG